VTVLSAAVLLFLVMDPFGNIPFFLDALGNVEPGRRQRVILRELLLALVVLVFFLFFGRYLLRALQISESSLTIAGGIILFLIAVRMIFPGRAGVFDEAVDGEPFLVPLAVPFVAGPSAMASVLFISGLAPERWPEWLLALLLAWSAAGGILLLSGALGRYLGRSVLAAMERLMGMLLTAVAVQMSLTGIRRFLEK